MADRTLDRHYDPAELVDAPEHHEYAHAFGTLTWGPWSHQGRPVQDRVRDFVLFFPPEDPVRHAPGGSLVRGADGRFGRGSRGSRLSRFTARDWRPGSLYELLARYGLKLRGQPAAPGVQVRADAFKEAAKRRNIKLRLLHGGVDIEASDMDATKATYLEAREKRKAARETRAAVKKMHEELREE